MTKLGKADVALNGLLDSLAGSIREWEPGVLKSEIEYRNSLLGYLRSSIPEDCNVQREYRTDGTTVDMHISWKGVIFPDAVFIEMKVNLQKKGVYDRLIGQIDGMKPAKNKIIIVLIGRNDEGLVGRLREKYPAEVILERSNVRIVTIK